MTGCSYEYNILYISLNARKKIKMYFYPIRRVEDEKGSNRVVEKNTPE